MDLSIREAAEQLGRSRATVGHWETGHARPSQQDLLGLLDLYDADEEMSSQLLQLRKEANQRGWWQSYKLPDKFAPFVGFEEEAEEKFHFEEGLIPGMLQTEAYTRKIHEVGRLSLPEEQTQEWVEVRLKRQDRLKPGGKLTLHAVIAEEALWRVVGTRQVMAEQLSHLQKMSKLTSVNLRILPFDAGAHVGMLGSIIVLRFPDANQDDIGYSETPLGGHIVDDLRDVAELSRMFERIQIQALPESDSLDMLATIREDHTRREKE